MYLLFMLCIEMFCYKIHLHSKWTGVIYSRQYRVISKHSIDILGKEMGIYNLMNNCSMSDIMGGTSLTLIC